MEQKIVDLCGRDLGITAIVFRVSLEVGVKAEKLQQRLQKRVDHLPDFPRVKILVERVPNRIYPIYQIITSMLTEDQLQRVLVEICAIEKQVLEAKMQRDLLDMIES